MAVKFHSEAMAVTAAPVAPAAAARVAMAALVVRQRVAPAAMSPSRAMAPNWLVLM
jgi:hypothetical protein